MPAYISANYFPAVLAVLSTVSSILPGGPPNRPGPEQNRKTLMTHS